MCKDNDDGGIILPEINSNVVVVGAGEVGLTVAKSLSAEGCNVYLIEKDPLKAERITDEVDAEVICGNGARPNILAKAGVISGGNIDVLVACTDRDEVNMLSCWIARKAGVKRVISRTRSLEFTDRPDWGRDLGIDAMISPERSIAREVMRLIEVRGATSAAELLRGKAAMYAMKISPSSPLAGLSLKDIRPKFPELEAVFVYVEHEDGTSGVPDGTTVLRANDICYAVTLNNSSQVLQKIVQPGNYSSKGSRKIFIVGGGKLGTQIASTLKSAMGNLALRIVDTNEQRCKVLSESFGDDLILNADGADAEMLTEEGISGAEAYICATPFDELNMMYCILARKMGVRKTIAIVKRKDYASVAADVGISSVVNTNTALSNVILQYVRYDEHALAYSMVGGIAAEMIEVLLSEDAAVVGKTLGELRLGKGSIVALIGRGSSVIVPVGSTTLKAGDHVILFALSSQMPMLARLFAADLS